MSNFKPKVFLCVLIVCGFFQFTKKQYQNKDPNAAMFFRFVNRESQAVNKKQKMYGLDYLGGAKYQDFILNNHPNGLAAGFFVEDDLFGSPRLVVNQLAKSNRAPAIRLNLGWKDDHKFSKKDFPKIVSYAKRYSRYPKKYKNVKWYFSGATEHLLDKKLATELSRQVLSVLPKRRNCIYVNNPWEGRGAFVYGNRIINEVHGSYANPPKGRFLFSYDGNNAVDDDITSTKRKMQNAEIFFLWHPAMNGRLKVDDPTPRSQRNSWPTVNLLKSILYLQKDAGSGINLPKNWLWKSHADRHKTPPEFRAYKPVLISPLKVNNFQLISDDETIVSTSSGPLPFVDGRWRYYFPDYGYKLSQRLTKIQKNPVGLIVSGGVVYGKVNPAFRAGTFR